MATLILNSLKCRRPQDIIGKDEPRIRVDGQRVWNGVVKKDQTVDIGVEVEFEGQATVIAEEMNNQTPKQIGDSVTVRESGNPKFLTFKTSGAWYEVYFEATPSASTSTTTGARRSVPAA